MDSYFNRRMSSERYDKKPRISSSHDRFVYDMLVELSEHIDFYHPIFRGKNFKNRSLGSVQTLIVEMALQDKDIINKLKKYMIGEGKHWTPVNYYNKKDY